MSTVPRVWTEDLAMVRSAQAGNPEAARRLRREIREEVCKACRLIAPEKADLIPPFRYVLRTLRENRFQRLGAYDGRSRIQTFVALATLELLKDPLLNLLNSDAKRGWEAFERLFRNTIQGVITRTVEEGWRADAYQEVFYRLTKGGPGWVEDCSGNFIVWVQQKAEWLSRQFVRSYIPRRRLPAPIKRLPELGQEIFRQVYWSGTSADLQTLALELKWFSPPPTVPDIAAALEGVQHSLRAGYIPPATTLSATSLSTIPNVEETIRSPAHTPEEITIEKELKERLDKAIEELPERERVCVLLELRDEVPLEGIARQMGMELGKFYPFRKTALKHLRDTLGGYGRN